MFSRFALLAASMLTIVMIGASPTRRATTVAAPRMLLGRFSERVRIPGRGAIPDSTTTAIVEVLRRNTTIYVDWRILRSPGNIVFCGIAHADVQDGTRLTWPSIDGWGNRGVGTLERRRDGYLLTLRSDDARRMKGDDVAEFYQTYRLGPSDMRALNE